MNAASQVKEFCKRNGINVNASGRVPMLSTSFSGGSMWIECFDNWPQALDFITKALVAYSTYDKVKPWTVPNTK